jgi:hypothetical protein
MKRYRGKELDRVWKRESERLDAAPTGLCQFCQRQPWEHEFTAIVADLQTHRETGELYIQEERLVRVCLRCFELLRNLPLTQPGGDV